MFKNKKISFILLATLFCFLLLVSISSTYANEANITNTTNEGIKGSLGNDTINLDGGIYSGENNTNISFDNSRNITIQSSDPNNKAIIDLGGDEGVTFINNTGAIDSLGSLTLKNLVFKNARFFALICFNSKLTVINCTFIHNNALLFGLIDMGYHSQLNIIDSDFINNTGRYGTAIATGPSTKSIRITNCDFINNRASESGGALFIFSSEFNNTNITNCNFINNSALNGGAIYNYDGAKNIVNCTFINNTASSLGGAIYNENNVNLNIYNGTFINNTGFSGGAIANSNIDYINISNSNFINNTAFVYGGAIYNDQSNGLNVSNSNFIGNNASWGGVLYSLSSTANRIFNSTFIGNNASDGGAIYNEDFNQIIINSTFTNNSATGSGGAIYNFGDNQNIFNSTFMNNFVTGSGGAIYNFGDNQNIFNSTFMNNSASDGGAIYTYSNYQNIDNCDFISNNASFQGGAIYQFGNNHTITNSEFIGNNVSDDGGAIYINGDCNNITNCNFKNNHADYRAGALYQNGFSNIINDSIFTNNSASKGGAIYSNSNMNGSVINSSFINNNGFYAGAIYISNTNFYNIINSSFVSNNASYGGAIFNNEIYMKLAKLAELDNMGLSQVINSSFINNTADFGGAVFNSGSLNISNSNFTNNTAIKGAGGIFNNKFLFVTNNFMTGNFVIGNFAILGGNVIYNNGSLNVVLSYLNNTTINVYKKSFTLFAYLTDDMGNPITGQNVSFFVNNVFIGNSTADEGYSSINYLINQTKGILLVNGDYSGHNDQNITIKNGYLLISKTNVLSTIILDKNHYWVNETLNGVFKVVNIGDGDGENITALISFPNSFKLYNFTVSKGYFDSSTGIWYIGDLALNESVSMFFTGSFKEKGEKIFVINVNGDNINTSSDSKAVIVYKKHSPGPNPGPNPGPKPKPSPNHSTDNNVSAGMKKSGLPIFTLLLILITSAITFRIKK